MKHWILLISIFSLGLMVLTACTAPGTPENPTQPPAEQTSPPVQKTEAPTPVVQASNTPAATATPAATETPSAQTSNLEGQTWKLDWYLDSQGKQTKVLAGTEITAEFKDGNLAGNAGCNNYFGTYQVDGNMLKVSGIGSTMMACLETGVMEQEQAYLAALGQSATFQAQADSLQIADASGKTILAYSVLQPLPLTGTLWELTAYNNGKQAVVSLLTGTKITALFAADNSLTGSAGCNTYTASYKVNGSQIQIGSAASTMMFCSQPDGIMDQETAYLKALESANTTRSSEISSHCVLLTERPPLCTRQYSRRPW